MVKRIAVVALLILPVLLSGQDRAAEVVFLQANGQATRLYEQSHALVVGVSDYTGGWSDLAYALDDAREVQSALQAQGFEVLLLENPDRATLQRELDIFVNEKGNNRNNRLLFYFAGHGHSMPHAFAGTMGYIIPADAPLPPDDENDDDARSAFKSGALDMEAFWNLATRIESRHALFIFDSCFSGSMFRLLPEDSFTGPSLSLNAANEPVRQFITAGGAGERVPDISIFKQQFLLALQGAADAWPRDGYVSGSELAFFLTRQTRLLSGDRQHPRYANLDRGEILFQVNDSLVALLPTGNPTLPAVVEETVGEISGRVLSDVGQKPISGAEVQLVSSLGTAEDNWSTVTRQDGSFLLSFQWGTAKQIAASGARWELQASAAGYGTVAEVIDLSGGGVLRDDWSLLLTSNKYAEQFPQVDGCAVNAPEETIKLYLFDLSPVQVDQSVLDPFLAGLTFQLNNGIRNHLQSFNLLDSEDFSVVRCDAVAVGSSGAAAAFGKRLDAPGVIWGQLVNTNQALQSVITFTNLEGTPVNGVSPVAYSNDVSQLFSPDTEVDNCYLAFAAFLLGNRHLKMGHIRKARACYQHAESLRALPREFEPLLTQRLQETTNADTAETLTPVEEVSNE